MIRILAFCLTLFFALPVFAAAPINQAGADALKIRVEEALDQFKASLAQSGMALKSQGDLMVEPAGTYYAITTPLLSLQMPGNITRTVGMVAINAIPTDDPDIFKTAVALPTPMSDTDTAGNPVGSLSIGRQAMNGLFHLKALTFTELNGRYDDVRAVNTTQEQESEAIVPSLTITLKLTPQGNLWSGPSETTLNNVSYKDKTGHYTAQSIRARTNVTGLDILARKEFEQKSQGVTDDSTFASLLGDYLSQFADTASTSLTAENITFETVKQGKPVSSGAVKSVLLQASSEAIRTNAATSSWNLSLDGISVNDPTAARFTPTRMGVKGSGKNLPFSQLFKVKDNASITPLLQKAGSSIAMESILIDAPGFGIDGKGGWQATAPHFTGNLNMLVRGTEDLLAWLTKSQGGSSVGPFIIPPQIIAVVTLVHMSGKPGKDAQGRDVLTYDLDFTRDGKIMLNGADISMLTGALNTPK